MAREGSAVFAKSVQSISIRLTAVTLGRGTLLDGGRLAGGVSLCQHWKAEVAVLGGCPGLHNECEISQGYKVRSSLKTSRGKKNPKGE